MLIECGNSRVDLGEDCEPPNTESCDEFCKTIIPELGYCGDGEVDDGEECDGGENCVNCMKIECGNNRLDRGEECDGG